MKKAKYLGIIVLAIVLLASCSSSRAPINGWHKRDHWYTPASNWHTKGSANF